MVLDISKDTRERRKKKKKELSTPIGRLKDKIKNEEKSIKSRNKISTKGGFGDATKRKEKKLEKLKLELKKLQASNISDSGRDFDKPLNKKTNTEGRDFEKSFKTKKSAGYSPRAKKLRQPSTKSSNKDESIGAEIARKLQNKSEDRRQKSQLNKPKDRAESLKDQFFRQGKRKYGPLTVDSTDRGMSKYGDSENWEELEMEEEMNLRKGGAVAKKYGMRAGGFTKRGGLYKKGY